MPPPTNTTPATAIAITASPYTLSLDVSAAPAGAGYDPPCAPGQFYAVWWAYTAQACDVVIAALAVTAAPDAYAPQLSVWTGTLPTLTIYRSNVDGSLFNWCVDGGGNYWSEIPVTPGITYYFQVSGLDASAPGSNLVFQVKRGPQAGLPTGSLLVCSDSPDWPAAGLSAVDGALLRLLALPACEQAAILPDGRTLVAAEQGGLGVANHHVNAFKLYDASLLLTHTVLGPIVANHSALAPVSSDRVGTWYVAARPEEFPFVTAAVVSQISPAGVVGAAWALPANSAGMAAMGVSPDGSTLYYTVETGSTDMPVRQYSLSGSVPLADLVAGTVGGDYGRDLLVLTDGTILATLRPDKSGAPTAWVVEHYSASGATLHTYSLPTSTGSPPRIAIGLDDPVSFWAMTFPGGEVSHFQHIQIATGATIVAFDVNQYSPGRTAGIANVPYGPAQSCPLLVVRQVPACDVCIPLTLTGMWVDCATGIITLAGTGFRGDATVVLHDPTNVLVPVTLLEVTNTHIQLRPDTLGALPAQYCATVVNPTLHGDEDGSGNPPPPPPPPPPSGCVPLTVGAIAGLPAWFEAALIANGATTCYSEAIFLAIEATANAHNMMLQRGSGCNVRPRLNEDPLGLDTVWCGHPASSRVLSGSGGIDHDVFDTTTGLWEWR